MRAGLCRETKRAESSRQALAKLQGALKAAPRDPANVALLGEAMAQLDPSKAISVFRELAEIHDAAGRIAERDASVTPDAAGSASGAAPTRGPATYTPEPTRTST